MTNFIKPEYLVSLYLILNDKEEVSLYNLASYAGTLNAALNEKNVRAVFLYSDKYVDEMLSDYKDYFEYIDLYEDVSSSDYCTPWIKRKVSNEVLSEKFTSYLSNGVLKVACDLNKKGKLMTIEEKIKIMQAYSEGKSIQCKSNDDNDWYDCNPSWDWSNYEYRIKPEPTYRPYKNNTEFLNDLHNRVLKDGDKLTHIMFDGLWLKDKNKNDKCIMVIGYDEDKIYTGFLSYTYESAFKELDYLNDEPFGIKE